MIAIISYHVIHFFRNRAVTMNERNRPHDRLVAKSRPIHARNLCAFHRAILPVFPLTSKPAISTSYPFAYTFTRARAHTHTHTHTHTHARARARIFTSVHFPPTALFHPTSTFSANLLPDATLSVTITQITCLTLYFCARACVCVCVCVCISNV